jgi:uncharacterized membrane protein
VYRNGRTVRFTNDVDARAAAGLGLLGRDQGPVPAAPVTWIPLVTFEQVTVDLPLAAAVPPGHGHTYTRESVDGWADVLRTPGWTPAKAEQLRVIVTTEE